MILNGLIRHRGGAILNKYPEWLDPVIIRGFIIGSVDIKAIFTSSDASQEKSIIYILLFPGFFVVSNFIHFRVLNRYAR